MYGLRSGRPEVMDIVQPGKAIGFVPAGASHHLTQDYGWWHVNDADEIYIPVPLTTGVLAFVILEATFADRWDKFQWYCLNCYTFLHERKVPHWPSGDGGLLGSRVRRGARIQRRPRAPHLSRLSDRAPAGLQLLAARQGGPLEHMGRFSTSAQYFLEPTGTLDNESGRFEVGHTKASKKSSRSSRRRISIPFGSWSRPGATRF